MAEKDNKDDAPVLFRKKNMQKTIIATIILIITVFLIAFIKHGDNITNTILSDYFFIVGIVSLIVGVFSRTVAWIIHKKFVLKPSNENENDIIKARRTLKLFAKICAYIGFVNIILSLIFLVLYYSE